MAWYNYLNPLYDIGKLGQSAAATGDTSSETAAIQNSANLQRQLGRQNFNAPKAYDPTQTATNTANQNQLVAALQKQANGTAPSAAEMQLQQQGAKNAAGAYGLAAALQGRNPGQALRSAQQTALQTQADTNAQAGQMRAQEQAAGQNSLAQALSGMQGQQATLRGQDINQTLGGQQNVLTAAGQQVSGANNLTNANVSNAATQNSVTGGLLGGGAAAATAAIKSDPAEKTDIHSAPLDKLADALKGFTFEYKHPGSPGEAPGPRVGVMATDALKGGPVGRSMVAKGGDGTLNLDGGNALGAALAMGAEALRRTRKAA